MRPIPSTIRLLIHTYFEYRIVKIEKGLFFIEYKTAPYGVWHEVDKKFKTKPKAEAWARKNLV